MAWGAQPRARGLGPRNPWHRPKNRARRLTARSLAFVPDLEKEGVLLVHFVNSSITAAASYLSFLCVLTCFVLICHNW